MKHSINNYSTIRLFKGEHWICPISGYYKVNELAIQWYDKGIVLKCSNGSGMIVAID